VVNVHSVPSAGSSRGVAPVPPQRAQSAAAGKLTSPQSPHSAPISLGASDGHVAFNEPTSSFASRTRIKTLAPKTRADNARFFASADEVPTHCLTQGLGTILGAKTLLLVAQGEKKADAVAKMVEGPLISMCPATALQLHGDAIVVVDQAAASRLTLTDYYNYTSANLPAWQRFYDPSDAVSEPSEPTGPQ